MSDIVCVSPDKDRFSTSDRSGNHTGKRMDPWDELTGIVFIGDVKCARIVGLCHVRFTGLGHPQPQRKTFNHFERSHGRNGPKGGFTVCEKSHHRNISVMYIA
jgi:hypothetical protein